MSKISVPLVLKNSGLNLVGSVFPLLVGAFTIPILIKGLGTDGFGILTLCWSLVGYFSIFDFGLTRALTIYVSDKISKNETDDAVGFFWTATILITAISVLASILCFLFGHEFEALVLSDTTEFSGQLNVAFKYIAIGIPIVALHTAIKGTLEGYGKFFATNLLQSALGVSNFLLPVFFIQSSKPIPEIVLTLIIARTIILLIHFVLLFRLEPRFLRFRISRVWFTTAIQFGGWMTVSNLVNPIMTYLDRFILSANVPVAQIAYYTTPFEIISRLLIVPNSVVRAMLPQMAKYLQTLDVKGKQLNKGILLVFGVQAIPVLLLAFGAKIFFFYWLGPEFATNASLVLSILALGIWINSVSLVPFSYLQTNGRADLIAKIHVLEFPIFIGLLFFVVSKYGVIGAAVVWTIRATFECICFFLASRWLLRKEQSAFFETAKQTMEQEKLQSPRQGILAIIVTYHPPLNLIENIRAIQSQVDQVLIVDNSIDSEAQERVLKITQQTGIQLIQNKKNLGIARALNQGFDFGVSNHFEFCITFDHDSRPDSSYVQTLLDVYRAKSVSHKIGWLAGSFKDVSTGASNKPRSNKLVKIAVAMTSGAFIPTALYEIIGGFREDFFIDYVDHEYCLRLQVFGFSVYLVPEATMHHELGKMKAEHWGMFQFYSMNYTQERRYFISRNRLILIKEFLIFSPKMFWNDSLFYIKELIKIVFVENQTWSKLKGCWHGTIDGLMGQTGPMIMRTLFRAKPQPASALPDENR